MLHLNCIFRKTFFFRQQCFHVSTVNSSSSNKRPRNDAVVSRAHVCVCLLWISYFFAILLSMHIWSSFFCISLRGALDFVFFLFFITGDDRRSWCCTRWTGSSSFSPWSGQSFGERRRVRSRESRRVVEFLYETPYTQSFSRCFHLLLSFSLSSYFTLRILPNILRTGRIIFTFRVSSSREHSSPSSLPPFLSPLSLSPHSHEEESKCLLSYIVLKRRRCLSFCSFRKSG